MFSPLQLPEDLAVSNVAIGMAVAAPFEGDNNWYRALVTRLDPGGCAELLYLDFGDRAEVELSQLKTLRSVATPVRLRHRWEGPSVPL